MRKILIFVISLAAVVAVSDAIAQQRNNPLLRRNIGGRPAPAAAPVPTPARAPATSAKNAPPPAEHKVVSIEFNNTELDLVFIAYGNLINKTILKDPALPTGAKITLKPKEGQELTNEEKIFAVETVLEMNGIHIEPYGATDKFVRAIPRAKIRTEGIPLILDPNKLDDVTESTHMVSFMIKLEHISYEEAQKVFEGLKSKDAQLTVFERTNSILVTDTGMNIRRMLEIKEKIDEPTPVTDQVFNRQVKFASCTEIKTVLEAIVQDSKQEQEKANGGKQIQNRPQPQQPFRPGLLGRNNQQNQNNNAGNLTQVNSMSDADRGTIRGKVLIIADERSNKLIIVTSQANMDFFDKVIEQLDVETTPDTVVKVYRLKYAEADKVSDMINDLIGNASSSKSSSKNNQNQNARNGTGGNMSRGTVQAKKPANQRTGEAKAGELSKENTTVLADERINGLVVMTSKELVPVVESIIEALDVKLSQVLIETCILEVGLGHEFKTGMDWVSGLRKTADGQRYEQAIGGGGGDVKPVAGIVSNMLYDAASVALPSIFTPGAGLNYAVFSERLNLGAVISLSQTDSTSKYIASPVIMTVDNKEAQIEATQARKFLSGYQSNSSGSLYGSSIVPQYEGKDIGIKIKVTPKINPNGTVMLEVEEEYSQVGPSQSIQDPNSKSVLIDTALTRKMSADVLLENQQTVVMGGLTDTLTETADVGIPILKDIPWVGRYLFGKTETTESRSELLVFLTPYVLADGDEAQAEAMRRKQVLSDPNAWDDHGWSKSKLADPVKAKELLRRQKLQWKNLDDEHKSQIELDKAKRTRILELKERALKDKEAAKKFDKELKEKEQEIEEDKAEAEKAEAEDAVDAESLPRQNKEEPASSPVDAEALRVPNKE